MSPETELFDGYFESFPRVSGDEPRPTPLPDSRAMFSPRERG